MPKAKESTGVRKKAGKKSRSRSRRARGVKSPPRNLSVKSRGSINNYETSEHDDADDDEQGERPALTLSSSAPKRLAPLDHIRNLYEGANANISDIERKICHKKDLTDAVRHMHQSIKSNAAQLAAATAGAVLTASDERRVQKAAKVSNNNDEEEREGELSSGAEKEKKQQGAKKTAAQPVKSIRANARDVLRDNLHTNARKYNELKLSAEEKARVLDCMVDELMTVENENESLRQMEAHQTADTRKIDRLKKQVNKLTRVLKVKSFKKEQYEHMKHRLQSNQVAFDAHIKSMEDALVASNREFEEVRLLVNQLEVGTQMAQDELRAANEQALKQREHRYKQITLRRQEAANATRMDDWRRERERQRLQIEAKMRGDLDEDGERKLLENLSATEGRDEKLEVVNVRTTQKVSTYEEAFAQIREATGVRTLDEMVEKFLGQGANKAALTEEKREADERQRNVREQVQKIKTEFAELKAAGIGGSELNREMYDKLDDDILLARQELKSQQSVASRLEQVLVKIKAGLNGLEQRLTPFDSVIHISSDMIPNTGEPSLDTIKLCELKLGKLLDEITANVTGQDNRSHHYDEDESRDGDVPSIGNVLQELLGRKDVPTYGDEHAKLHINNVRVRANKYVSQGRGVGSLRTGRVMATARSADSAGSGGSGSTDSGDEDDYGDDGDEGGGERGTAEGGVQFDARELKKKAKQIYDTAVMKQRQKLKRGKSIAVLKHRRSLRHSQINSLGSSSRRKLGQGDESTRSVDPE